MFALFDNFLITQSTRLMQWLNREQGFTAPAILRESLMGFMVSYGAFGLVVLAKGDMVASVAVIIFGAMLYPTLWNVLNRYASDADKEWTSSLAMRYMAQAIGKQEGMRVGRLLGWISVVVYPAMTYALGVSQPPSFTAVYFTAMVSGLAHEYLAAAEPTAPGERRKQSELELSHAHMR